MDTPLLDVTFNCFERSVPTTFYFNIVVCGNLPIIILFFCLGRTFSLRKVNQPWISPTSGGR